MDGFDDIFPHRASLLDSSPTRLSPEQLVIFRYFQRNPIPFFYFLFWCHRNQYDRQRSLLQSVVPCGIH